MALQDTTLMAEYEEEYFEIYNHFKENPEKPIGDEDWRLISILSDKKRLWYRVGAHMAQKIDEELGRNALVNLIPKPAENFINTYLEIKKNLNTEKDLYPER